MILKRAAMKQNIVFTAALTLLSLCWLPGVFAATDAEEKKIAGAIMVAEDFLLLIDTGQYGRSWDVCSSLLQSRVTKEAWIQQISAVRPALGEPGKREIVSAEHMTELPGAPDGEYIVIQYETSFADKKNAVETVTPMLDKDGQWRVSGYYIR
ncbi:MAG: DUF4019 domain-containing protein [Desulfobulbaceae bacterium]|nr:DUF4019 domain-containing protein [Desulfobulbaceae bacterium]